MFVGKKLMLTMTVTQPVTRLLTSAEKVQNHV
jgi:hypothetical protein